MIHFYLLAAACLVFLLAAARAANYRSVQRTRIEALIGRKAAHEPANWQEAYASFRYLNDKLGRAGFVTRPSRQRAKATAAVIVFLSIAAGTSVSSCLGLPLAAGAGAGAYLGVTACFILLSRCKAASIREVSFQVPIFLESIILLVESGLAILPAVEKVLGGRASGKTNLVTHYFRLVYELSSRGMPFGDALAFVADHCEHAVLRHVFLHLDISGNEGGELIPSLRSLSSHAHLEWKLSVEQRVKRLENLVVFPVFASVIGLILLTAAVPMVPLLELQNTLATDQQALGDVRKKPF